MRIFCYALISSTFAASLAMGATNSNPGIGSGRFSLNGADPGQSRAVPIEMAQAASNQPPAPAPAAPHNCLPLTRTGKFRYYLGSTYGPLSIFSSMAMAGYHQERNSIPEWGQGLEGYGKRFGSSMGQKAVEDTARFGLQSLMHEDPRYFASSRSGLLRRTFYAVGQTFVAHKDSGGIRPGYSYFAGMATGVYVSRQWYPPNEQTRREYIREGVTRVAVRAAKNIFKEFWPDIKRRLRR